MSIIKRAILMSAGSEGNVGPFVSIGTELASRGLDVYLLTHNRFSRRFSRAPIRFIDIDDDAEYIEFLRDGELLNRASSVASFFRRHFLPRAYKEIRSILDIAREEHTVIVASEMPGISARIACELTGMRMISICPNPGFFATRALFEELLATQLAEDVARIRGSFGLPACTNWASWWRSELTSIALWPAWFSRGACGRVEHVGFVWMEDIEENDWERHVPEQYVLVTGGTGYFASAPFFKILMEACGTLSEAVVLVCPVAELVPTSLPSNVMHLCSVANLSNAMRKASTVINHGGMGTVAQAMAAGKPQVMLAAGGDRPQVARIAQSLGVGCAIPKTLWNSQYVAGIVRSTMSSVEIRHRCQEVARRASERGHRKACDIILGSHPQGSQ